MIKKIYPDLYRQEINSPKIRWNQLRRVAQIRWHRTHPWGARVWHPTPEGNRWLARRFFKDEYWCAAKIIEGETAGTWSETIWNYAGSGAYGLGQARPRSKMLAYGADAYTNPWTQMVWFRAYANGRYGGVCPAAAQWTYARSW